MIRYGIAAALVAVVALGYASAARADVAITDQTFVRHDGGTDATILDCNNAATTVASGGDGSSNRQQNEPTAAIDPLNPMHMTAGANEYCPVQTIADAWAGFYVSSNGGASWTNSLLPGYPTDTSPEGASSSGRTKPIVIVDSSTRSSWGIGTRHGNALGWRSGPRMATALATQWRPEVLDASHRCDAHARGVAVAEHCARIIPRT